MREEITEQQHWRTTTSQSATDTGSWSSRLKPQQRVDLAAEAVDAALAEVACETPEKPDTTDIISSLATQLEMLEQQRMQIQRLLDQAQGK